MSQWKEHTASELADILGINSNKVASLGKVLTAMTMKGKIPKYQNHNKHGGKKFYLLPPIDNNNIF